MSFVGLPPAPPAAPEKRAGVLSLGRARRPGKARQHPGGGMQQRPEQDFYPTPWCAARAGLQALARYMPAGDVEEPCAGNGDIVRVLQERGRRVIASDLMDWRAEPRWGIATGVDFLRRRARRADIAVFNPPFELDEEFVLHAGALGFACVAAFLRLSFLAGVKRGGLHRGGWNGLRLARVAVCSDRVAMWPFGLPASENGPAMDMAWYLFARGERRASYAPREAKLCFINTKPFVEPGDAGINGGRGVNALHPEIEAWWRGRMESLKHAALGGALGGAQDGAREAADG